MVTASRTTFTVGDLVDQTRRQLTGSVGNAGINFLKGTITDSATTLELDDSVTHLRQGTTIEVGAEEMYVRQVSEVGTVTVVRGFNVSEATSHTAGTTVRIAPSYTTRDIFESVLEAISALNGTGLYDFVTVEVEMPGDRGPVTLPTDVGRPVVYVQGAQQKTAGSSGELRPVTAVLHRDQDSALAASGYKVSFPLSPSSGTARVTVAQHFAVPTTYDATILDSDSDLRRELMPCISLNAAWRLILSKEAQRLSIDHSHGSRRGEEVPPLSVAQLGRALESQYHTHVQRALEQQVAQYPYKMTGNNQSLRAQRRSHSWFGS